MLPVCALHAVTTVLSWFWEDRPRGRRLSHKEQYDFHLVLLQRCPENPATQDTINTAAGSPLGPANSQHSPPAVGGGSQLTPAPATSNCSQMKTTSKGHAADQYNDPAA